MPERAAAILDAKGRRDGAPCIIGQVAGDDAVGGEEAGLPAQVGIADQAVDQRWTVRGAGADCR